MDYSIFVIKAIASVCAFIINVFRLLFTYK